VLRAFLDFNFDDTTFLLGVAAVLAGAGALLSGIAALVKARRVGREEGCRAP
jgi:hypothetical protein